MSDPLVLHGIAIQAVRSSHLPGMQDGRLVLQAEPTWHFEGPAEKIGPLQVALGSLAEPFGTTNLLVSFGNAVGHFQLPILGHVEIRSGKWNAEHFDWMLHDLMAVASALPFSAGASSALPYDRSFAAHEEVLYHAFVYLRHILSDTAPRDDRLLPSLMVIVRDPHRQFTRKTIERPIETAREIHPRDLPGFLAPSAQLCRVKRGPVASLPLTRALGGHIPRFVPQSEVASSLDTPENRFVKSFLALVQGLLDGIRRAVPQPGLSAVFRERTISECDNLERSLRPVTQAALWGEVGQMTHFPAASTVLQRRSDYRDVYRHFVRLRQAARVPLSPPTIRDLLETKDIALLYELWTFFAMARELESLLGPPDSADGVRQDPFQLTAEWDIRVQWNKRATLYYNPSFSRNITGTRHSYSVGLRPDLGLQIDSGPAAGLHLFDAKFKLERLDALFSLSNSQEDTLVASEERAGTFKRADLYKMHAYRDAIPEARSVRILYPGSETRFFPAPIDTSILVGRGSHVDGVGGIPLLPSSDPNGASDVSVSLVELLQCLCL